MLLILFRNRSIVTGLLFNYILSSGKKKKLNHKKNNQKTIINDNQ